MTDIEMTRLCAEAMSIRVQLIADPEFHYSDCPYYVIPTASEAQNPIYEPLHDDRQAMALVKHLKLRIMNDGGLWIVDESSVKMSKQACQSEDVDLNLAIATCVAKMQSAAIGAGGL